MSTTRTSFPVSWLVIIVSVVTLFAGSVAYLTQEQKTDVPAEEDQRTNDKYKRRRPFDVGGYQLISTSIPAWNQSISLDALAKLWRDAPGYLLTHLDSELQDKSRSDWDRIVTNLCRTSVFGYQGHSKLAYQAACDARALAESDPALAEEWLYTTIYCQGVAALRRGEDENCIMCRGESSCIIPISPAAVHIRRSGSTDAVKHFTEYLDRFPDDIEVRWLLNLAHMTLGEHPQKVDPRYLLTLTRYSNPEFDIGRFRDIGHLVGVNRLNQAGGAIMDDFDNDGLLDLVVSSWDTNMPLALYRNKGDGTFQERAKEAGLIDQLGGLYCCQADYDNDGYLDILVVRGAWVSHAVRPSLLRNNGDGTFTNVTRSAGLLIPVNSISASWADYDNDGFLDVFICCERQTNLLFRNRGDGTFEQVAEKAGVAGYPGVSCKGAAWIDFDNDRYPDLFLNNISGSTSFYRNNRDGTFTLCTSLVGIDGPAVGFSCWAWDYDNDGFLDIFATSYDRPLADIVRGLVGEPPHTARVGRLYRNISGKRFQDVTREVGLDSVYATMGSNFGDFDNDGFLDFYLGTGDPGFGTLVPNRMFKNVAGKRFSEITSSAGVGHLQKGHGVCCGDWDRNGTVDVFVQTGGAVPGDMYHNILFQNPGQVNGWLNVKLVGKKSNRSAIGARIKVETADPEPVTIHRHVSSGSSFGANPLEQHIGLGKASRVARLEVYWPMSGTTQVFTDLATNQALEITEFATDYRVREYKPIALPK